MEQLEKFIMQIKGYIKTGMGLQIGGGVRLPASNLVWVSDQYPTADIMTRFDDMVWKDEFDFVVFLHSLAEFDNLFFTLKKVVKHYLKKGGYLIISQSSEKWYFQEFEGYLYLFDEVLQIEQKIFDGKDYMFICRLKGGVNV